MKMQSPLPAAIASSVGAPSARPARPPGRSDASGQASAATHLIAGSGSASAAAPAQPEQAAQALAQQANQALASSGHHVQISRNESTGHFVVRVLDADREVVRQYPSEDFLAMSEHLQDLRGVLFEGQG